MLSFAELSQGPLQQELENYPISYIEVAVHLNFLVKQQQVLYDLDERISYSIGDCDVTLTTFFNQKLVIVSQMHSTCYPVKNNIP